MKKSFIITCILFSIFACVEDKESKNQNALQIGPNFSIQLPDKNKFELSQQKGKVILINFWASYCSPCIAEMEDLDKLYKKFKKDGFLVLALSFDKKQVIIDEIQKKLELTYPVLIDKDQEIAKKYNVATIPTSIIIDKKGKIFQVFKGKREWMDKSLVKMIELLIKK